MMTQHLRLSQFVVTFGPGAILEGLQAPRIIPRPDIGLFTQQSNLNPADFEISDQRMSRGLLGGNRIFRLPSNAELGIPGTQVLYRTRAFPEWKLCHNTGQHNHRGGSGFSVLYTGRNCPLCHSDRTEHQEPVRFVRTCSAGHLDDVDWWHLVHSRNNQGCQHNRWFIWQEKGSSLSQIDITCPRCRATVNLGWAYRERWPCSGRYPERENPGAGPHRPGCGYNAFIIQRQASNLRIPEIRTLFTIPPRHTRLHNLLQLTPVYSAIVANPPGSENALQSMLTNLVNQRLISQATADEILNHPWNEIRQAIQDVLSPVPSGYTDLLLEELHAFIDASTNGIPPVRASSPVLIEVDPNRVVRVTGPSGRRLRIVPVLRLRTVIVQTGYRREVDTQNPAQIVDVSFPDPVNPQVKWYPGIEFFGEGIFIMLDDNDGWHFGLTGNDASSWQKTWQNRGQANYPDHVFRNPARSRDELHPVFVWWHTLSHLLIRAISQEAGYPAASIRERVYLEHDNGMVRGGILLHAVQPGSEGTLGGLIALAPNFQRILDRAFDMLRSCSSDPLCYENRFRPEHYAGSACYACVFLSETSCEHRNMWLDRRVLLNNLP